MAGTLKFVPGPQLPRHDKSLLERTIANAFLAHLSQREGSAITDVQSNKDVEEDAEAVARAIATELNLEYEFKPRKATGSGMRSTSASEKR